MTGPNGNPISSAEILASRLMWMRDRQGRDPLDLLRRQVAFGELSRAQANEVGALLDLPTI